MAIQWGYHFVTGLRAIDRQHEGLVALVNQLEAAIADELRAQEIDKVFHELAHYAREHFILEEQLMDEAGIDRELAAAHKDAHKSFVEQLAAMWQTRTAEPTTTKNLLEFMTTWIYRHILISDHEMARHYYRNKGLTAPPSLLLTTGGSDG